MGARQLLGVMLLGGAGLVAAQGMTSGAIGDFDGREIAAATGSWQVSTDQRAGGSSEARMQLVKPGAGGSRGALEITGTIKAGAPFPWAGAMFFPGAPPMSPVDASRFREIVFKARGDGREYQVMVFATRFGAVPESRPFTAGAEWREVVMPFKEFGTDGSDLRGILFSAGAQPGAFQLVIDDVRLR